MNDALLSDLLFTVHDGDAKDLSLRPKSPMRLGLDKKSPEVRIKKCVLD